VRVIKNIESDLPEKISLRVWYLGANSLVLQSARARIYIDPFLVTAALHDGQFRRREDPPVAAREVRSLDGVLITHEHKDHCNPYTLRELLRDRSVPVVAPQASAKIIGEAAGQAAMRIVQSGDRFHLAGFDIEVCDSGDTVAADPVSYLIRYQTLVLYVAGDALLLPRLPVDATQKLDAAFLPIATNPAGRKFYLSASEWADMVRKLAPSYAVPVHWDVWADYYFDPVVLRENHDLSSLTIVPVGRYLEFRQKDRKYGSA
jgi:L-ascorbate 6-phosphate lactonase